MSNLPKTTSLFRRVAARLRLASLGFRLYVAFLAVCAGFFAVLLASRLLGFMNGWFESVPLFALWTWNGQPVHFVIPAAHFLVIPAAAAVIGLIWLAVRGGVTSSEAAREIDRQKGTKDLFLTLSLLDRSVGDYRPLVAGAAESKASSVRATEVVPFRWQPKLVRAVLFALMVALAYNLPQFDPFGKVAASEIEEQMREKLQKEREATRKQIAQLKKRQDADEAESPEVKKAIEDLKRTFQKAKPAQKRQNLKKLTGHQKDLGRQYRKLRSEKLKDLLSKTTSSFQFAKQNEATLKKWTRELQEGSTSSLQKEFDELKHDLQRLAKTDDPAKKAELRKKIEKRLKDLQEFASDNVNSKQLTASLERALKQLEMSKMKGLSEESMRALRESVELSKLQLKEIGQSARDLKELEEALKTLQMAKQLNQGEQLDGEMCEGCNSLADYQELYAQLMAQMGQGEGQGEKLVNDGGRGVGRGGKTMYDDESKSGFKTEQARSQITAGKVLLSLKTKGLSDRGDAEQNYREAVRQVRQGVSEAILQEEVPPGYHESIKKYFDTIERTADPVDEEQQ